MATALSSDAKIYYEVHGSGPAVLFVHGSGGHHAAWWQQVAGASDVILAHPLGGLQNEELTALVKADRARAEQLPALDRLLTPESR